MTVAFLIVLSCSITSQALAQTAQDFDSIMSRSTQSTITVTGESSQWITPDQATLSISTPSQSGNSTAALALDQNLTEKLKDAIKAVSPKSAVTVEPPSINPSQDESPFAANSLYEAYSDIQVTADLPISDNLVKNLASQGIMIQNPYVTEVTAEPAMAGNKTHVSISYGSSRGPNCAQSSTCFDPSPITVLPGTTVTWTNNDTVGHTVTSGMPSDLQTGTIFDSGLLKPGAVFSHTFANSGNFDYYCQVHPWMTGLVRVAGQGISAQGTTAEPKYQITMSIAFHIPQETLGNAIHDYQQKEAKAKQMLEDAGVPQGSITEEPLRLNPANGPRVFPEMSVSSRMTVDVPIGDVDKIVNATNSLGGNVNQITLSASKSLLYSTTKDLTSRAISDAIGKVQGIIGPAGLQIKSIKDMQISQLSEPVEPRNYYLGQRYPVPSYSASDEASISAVVQFQVGQ